MRGGDDGGLSVDLGVEHVLARERLQRLHERPADEVREAHLAAARAAHVVVDDDAVVDQELRGTLRTLVAVGTVSDSSMFAARVFGMPLSVVTRSSDASAGVAGAATLGAWAGIGWGAAGLAVVRATGWAPITGMGAVTGRGSVASGAAAGAGSDTEEW